MNKLTLKGNKISYCFTLYVADAATFLASNSVLGPYFSSENSLFFFLMVKNTYFRVCIIYIVNITFLILKGFFNNIVFI